MSELITAENIDMVIKKNSEIKEEVLSQAIKLRSNPEIMQVASPSVISSSSLQSAATLASAFEISFVPT